MKQILKLFYLLLIILFSIHLLNNKVFDLPPIAKLLDPFHGYAKIKKNDYHNFINTNLKNDVEIIWDENYIPHIFAQNDGDLYFAQGYVVAQDRLWQMDFVSRVYQGRLSEILGYHKEIISNDRFMRTVGVTEGAKKSLSTIAVCEQNNTINYNWDGQEHSCFGEIIIYDSQVYSMLVSFSNGVNEYINSIAWDEYPIEYKILDYGPEYWTPYKTCILLKSMTLTLTGRNSDIVFEVIKNKYGKENAKILFPDFPYFVDPIIPKKSYDLDIEESCSNQELDFKYDNDFSKLLINKNSMSNPGIGSNNWAVHSDHTIEGHALLANDPHLGLTLPNVWYVMQLSTPELDIMGATLPGAPGIISGFNNYVAWGETNGESDVSDFYRIIQDSQNLSNYLYDGESVPFQTRNEKILIRGHAFSLPKDTSFTVKSTIHGPILAKEDDSIMRKYSSRRGIEAPYTYAFRWTAQSSTKEIKSFYDLNRAKNYEDFISALSTFDCPGQNFIYADVEGNIGIYHSGKIPISCYKGILPGEDSRYLWSFDDSTKFIPKKNLPKAFNPDGGFLSSANQYPVLKDYPYNMNGKYWPAYRGSRINDFISDKILNAEKLDINDMKNLQNDAYNKFASILLPLLLNSIEKELLIENKQNLNEVFLKMKTWDYFHNINSYEGLFFDTWYDELNDQVWKDLFTNTSIEDINNPTMYPNSDVLIHLIQEDRNSYWFDDFETPEKEVFRSIALQTYKNSIDYLNFQKNDKNTEKYKDGRLASKNIEHLLSSDQFSAFSKMDVLIPGSRWSPNAVKVKSGKLYGPSWRYIVQMKKDSIHAIGIYPGGQSGNPADENYEKFISSWTKGNYLNL
ncbi:penicillin acylase family protein, partial [Candidatus Marinimicrobia bacterium]|nr:penicillin acylase family protein [Candidatus Neomarinimicrobiota bacterium]